MSRANKVNHPYLELEGEALDNHMMAMHGWTMQMVLVKGSKSGAATDSRYISDSHRVAHGHDEPTAHLDPDQ